jgi:hypothetical protein
MCSYQHCNNLACYTSITVLTTKSEYSLSRRFLFNDELKEVIPRRQRCLLTVTGQQGGTTPHSPTPRAAQPRSLKLTQSYRIDAARFNYASPSGNPDSIQPKFALGEPRARKTAWGFRFGQSDNCAILFRLRRGR